MAELSPEEQLHLDIMSADRAVPGQSLTNDPDSPLPFEQAPQFTDLATAIDYTFVEITESPQKLFVQLN